MIGITSGCSGCHEASFVWMGVTAYPISPATLTTGAQYTGFQTRPRAAAGTYNVADAAHPLLAALDGLAAEVLEGVRHLGAVSGVQLRLGGGRGALVGDDVAEAVALVGEPALVDQHA